MLISGMPLLLLLPLRLVVGLQTLETRLLLRAEDLGPLKLPFLLPLAAEPLPLPLLPLRRLVADLQISGMLRPLLLLLLLLLLQHPRSVVGLVVGLQTLGTRLLPLPLPLPLPRAGLSRCWIR